MKLWEKGEDRCIRAMANIKTNQFEFRSRHSTREHIFILGQMVEMNRVAKRSFHFGFGHLEKVYDLVPRSKLWDLMRHQGVSSSYTVVG